MTLRRLVSSALPLKVSPETLHLHGISQPFSSLSGSVSRHCVHSPVAYHSSLQPCFSPYKSCHDKCIHTSSFYFAGHSKWANIKHVKGAQDKLKGQRANMLSRQIQAVLARNPDTNPKMNHELANVIKAARSNNVPNDVIERAIERVSKLRDPSSISVFDGRGLSNTAILIECFSVNPVHTKQILQGIVKKYGFNLHIPALDLFDHKGIIEADLPEAELGNVQLDPDNFSLDKYVDIAIEAGSEDVTLEKDSEKHYLRFTCAPQDLEKVQSALEADGLIVSSAERTYIPNVIIPVSKDFLETVDKLTEKLDFNADVVKFHFNLELEGSS